MKRRYLILIATCVFASVVLGFYFLNSNPPLIVAVVDTGIDLRIPLLKEGLAASKGKNFFDNSDDISDQDGHGTKVALLISEGCGAIGCRILPIKVSKSGIGITPKILASAIRFATAQGARVINISFGLTESDPDLEAAVAEANLKNVILVAAAGTGIANPFRAEPLNKIFPQSYPSLIVVGAARSLEMPDLLSNFGPELDVVVTDDTKMELMGSSFAAAKVSAEIASALKRDPRAKPATLRASLRATSTAPKERYSGQKPADVANRLGFGAFNRDKFASSRLLSLNDLPKARIIRDLDGVVDVEVSGAEDVADVSADWICTEKATADQSQQIFSIEAIALKKGRARLTVKPIVSKKPAESAFSRSLLLQTCKLRIKLGYSRGQASEHVQTLLLPLAEAY